MLYWSIFLVTRKGPEWSCRLITLIHGAVVTYFAIKDIVINKQSFDLEHNIPLSDYQKYYLSITFSYFLFDLSWIHLFGSETFVIYLHHITSICFLFNAIWTNTGGPGISWGLAGLEFTNPYLQMRWFLRTHGYNHTPIHTANEVWFVFSFILIRSVGGTILLYFVEIHPDIGIFTKICVFMLYIVSWLLIGQIFMFIKKKYWYKLRGIRLTASRLSMFPYAVNRTRIINLPPIEEDGRDNSE